MSRISEIIPRLNFTLNFKNPNPTRYQLPNPKTDIHTGFRNNMRRNKSINFHKAQQTADALEELIG